jgi:hypothetical protein
MCNNTNAQSIISTANSKSGILVGSETAFAGISYENASDKFSFNYKLTKQDDSISKGDKYPNFWGINIGTGIKIDKSKAALVTDEKWQGGVDFDITIFRTWDHTTSLDKKESENGITQNQAKIIQKTLYLRLSNSFERFRSFESFVLNADTTFITLKNPLQNNFTGTIGFYTMYQLKSKYFFSYALSANLSSIKNSTTKLTETNLTSFTGLLFNSKDSTKVLQTAKQETYFAGKPEFELFFVPRADVFFRYKTGTGKPVLGFLFSYSPLVSSFKSVKIRNCFAIGPTFGLDIFTDQVLFAIMNEFVQDKKGYYKYALTFHASFPIIFK